MDDTRKVGHRVLDVPGQGQVQDHERALRGLGVGAGNLASVVEGRLGGAAQAGGGLHQGTGEDGGSQAAAGDHEVGEGHGLGQARVVGHRTQPVGGSEDLGTVGAGVHLRVRDAPLTQCGHGGTRVGAGAHHEHAAAAQRWQPGGGQVQPDGHHGAAGAGQPGLAGHAAGGGRGVLDGATQDAAERAFLRGTAGGTAKLAGDLPLAHHHGLEPGGGGEQVVVGVVAPGVGELDGSGPHPGMGGEDRGDVRGHSAGRDVVGGVHVQGEPVAGAQHEHAAQVGHALAHGRT